MRNHPAQNAARKNGRFIQRGPILVKPAGDSKVTAGAADAALEAVRERDDEGCRSSKARSA
jgi:threonine dehydratase